MCSASGSGRFSAGEIDPGTHWIEGSVRPRTGLDNMEKREVLPLPGLEIGVCPLLTTSLPRNTWMKFKGWTTERGQSPLHHGALTDSGPLILLITVHWGLVFRRKSGLSLRLMTKLRLMPRLRIHGTYHHDFWGVLFSPVLSCIVDC
jgi:hypothetical protein